MLQKIIILGTGGTIAGWADDPAHAGRYRSGQIGIEALSKAMPGLDVNVEYETEQVAQIDSKDMSEAVWRDLLAAVVRHLSRADVSGVVIAHGTDTLEETAFFLSALLPTNKPVVLTGAMRAANAPQPDGPGNLSDAVRLAASGQVRGVCVVFARQVHAATQVQKIHASELDAFTSMPSPALGRITTHGYRGEGLSPRPLGNWPTVQQVLDAAVWPRVEWLSSHAGASPWLIRCLMQAQAAAPPVRGLVVAATGAGTVHSAWEQTLSECMASSGIEVWISSRCVASRLPAQSRMMGRTVPWTPAQARVGLMLTLLT
jgi:L-asparaginase